MGGYGGMGGYGMPAPIPTTFATPGTPLPGTVTGQGTQAGAATTGTAGAADQTGTYLGASSYGMAGGRIPRVVPNPMDNTLLIQGTQQEYESILKILRELDIPPRQVLVDAKIYEVQLTGALASGVSAFLQRRGESGGASVPTNRLRGSLDAGVVNFSIGTLVGQSRELLAFLQARENATFTRILSAPSVIATDSIPATINVGSEVPTLTAQAATGVQTGGSSLFAQTISNRNTGVTLAILARVNPSGIVTLVINQEVSAPEPPPTEGINSPAFSKRAVQTQVTVQDGDTIAIGGIIQEDAGATSGGFPLLHRIPGIGAAFGNKSYSKGRTELIIFMTPRVIYDTNQMRDASEELKSRLKKLQRYIEE